MWNLTKKRDGYIFCISVKGFKLIRPFVKKTKTKVEILDKIGLPFFFYKYRKRKIFFLGIGIFAICLYALSLFIWKIEIEGNYTYTDEMFLKYLAKNKYTVGMKKNNVKSSEIEKKIMSKFEDVAWVTAEVTGTKLRLYFEETQENYKPIEEKEPCDIVANKDGIITSIVTRNGMPKVKKGDVVEKGDVLVAGDLLIKMEEVLKDVEFTHSDADIYAKTIYEYNDSLEFNYTEKVRTGNKKKGYSFSLFNNKITIFHPRIKYEKYDRIVKNKTMKIGKDFYLPFQTITMEYNEYNYEERQYTIDEAKSIIQKNLEKFIQELEEKGVQILENNVKIIEEKDGVIAEGDLIVIEKIGREILINPNERRQKYEDEIVREDDTDSQ